MTQLLDIFGFLSVITARIHARLRGVDRGRLIFLWWVSPPTAQDCVRRRITRGLTISALALAVVQICYVAANSGILLGSTDLQWSDLPGAGFTIAGALTVSGALLVAVMARTRITGAVFGLSCTLVLTGSVMASHSAARLDNRALLATATAVHHLASAAWIGSMPYLLIALRHSPPDAAAAMTARFSRLAMASVAALVAAGAVLSYSYVGTPSALTGTTYGVMLASKIGLTVLLLALGGLNFKIVQAVRRGLPADMLPLRRFAEAEVGIGFTILLAAASLTSTPPAIDVVGDRVSPPEIWARMSPGWPRMKTPALASFRRRRRFKARWMLRPQAHSCPGSCCSPTLRPTSPGRSTTTIGPVCACWRSALYPY